MLEKEQHAKRQAFIEHEARRHAGLAGAGLAGTAFYADAKGPRLVDSTANRCDQKPREIPSLIRDLRDRVESGEMLVDAMRERVSPLMRPRPVQGSNPADSPMTVQGSPLGEELSALLFRLDRVFTAFNEIREAIEL